MNNNEYAHELLRCFRTFQHLTEVVKSQPSQHAMSLLKVALACPHLRFSHSRIYPCRYLTRVRKVNVSNQSFWVDIYKSKNVCIYIRIYTHVVTCCFRQGVICSVRGIIRWFHHCANIIECTYTSLGGTAHYGSCVCYTSYYWQCGRFVYTSISTNR